MRAMTWIGRGLLGVAVGLCWTPFAHADVFDNFNAGEGRFNANPSTGSGTTTGITSDSVAEAYAADSVDVASPSGSQRINLVHDAIANSLRLRHLSGGGSPANNATINVTAGSDGFIGYYLKTNFAGLKTTIALDAAAATTATMDAGIQRDVTADGKWHYYEWDLDSASDWTVVPGIGGDGILDISTHTIDSIFIFGTEKPSGTNVELFLDFVAVNPNGSISSLVPEPGSLGLLGLGALSLLSRRRRA